MSRKEDEYWILKSRSVWLKVGDQNTAFFDKQTKTREIHNRVREIASEVKSKIISFSNIKQEASTHFQSKYIDLEMDKARDFLSCIILTVSDDDNLQLVKYSVGNNTGGVNQCYQINYFSFHNQICIRYFNDGKLRIYATVSKEISVYQ